MSNESIKQLLAQLHQEIQQTELTEDTRSMIAEFDKDIDRLLDPDDDHDTTEPALDMATKLEAEFASQHPLAEKLLREITEALSRMGI